MLISQVEQQLWRDQSWIPTAASLRSGGLELQTRPPVDHLGSFNSGMKFNAEHQRSPQLLPRHRDLGLKVKVTASSHLSRPADML